MVKQDLDDPLPPDSSVKSGPIPVGRLLKTPFVAGEVIGGRYRVDRIIAQGGMGVIVAAQHLELDEPVAIKFLRDEFAAQSEIVGRFAREAKAAAKIKCEYTATVHDVGISAERGPYIVMEYLEGQDLEVVLEQEGRLPSVRATELMMQASEAIAVAHANGIIHRDIKPANLFLVKRDHGVPIIKVLDFGVSKTALTGNVFGGTISLVKTQSLVGSPIYMSPEQIRGNNSVEYVADIWSIGAVLYELVTGETAFTGSSITELCAAVLESEPTPIAKYAPDVPAGLSDVIMRCLEKDSTLRWQSVAELVVALAPYAPKRARMSVERVVAISKVAGLVPQDFAAPTTLTPPPLSSSGAPAAPTAPAAPAAQPPSYLSGLTPLPPLPIPAPLPPALRPYPQTTASISSTPTVEPTDAATSSLGFDVEHARRRARRRDLTIGILLLVAAAVMAAVYFVRRDHRRSSDATAAAAAATATVIVSTTANTAPAASTAPSMALTIAGATQPTATQTGATTEAPPQPQPRAQAQAPATPTARTGAVVGGAGRAAPWGGAVPAKPSASPPTPSTDNAAAAQRKTDQVRSAIDDRK